MPTLLELGATAALGFVLGRLAAQPQLHRLRRLLAVAQHRAGHDQLTGLPNRLQAAQIFAVKQAERRPTVVALLDLDHFKNVNDRLGHHIGDDLLRTIAATLADTAKRHNGIAARLGGGDEFLLLLPAHSGEPATPVADILAALARPAALRTDDGEVTVRPQASAGITVYDGGPATFSTLLDQADIALYHAKLQRGTHRVYHPQMRMPRNAARYGPRRRDQRPADPTAPTDGGMVA